MMAKADEETIVTSDNVICEFPSAELLEKRADSYRNWSQRVTAGMSDGGHEAVVRRAEPLGWKPFTSPLRECKVALLSTGGVHLRNQEPFNVFDHRGDSSIREIPSSSQSSDLTVTHTHYATDDAISDINVMFPIERLGELASEQTIGSVSPMHFGMMGFAPDPSGLLSDSLPQAIDCLHQSDVDAVLLTPG